MILEPKYKHQKYKHDSQVFNMILMFCNHDWFMIQDPASNPDPSI